MAKIIVTGGLGVLGRAVAAELRARGDAVAVIDLVTGDCGAEVTFQGIDLADAAAVEAAYAKAVRALGGLDGLANVAGGFTWEAIATGSAESWDAMYRINLRTAVTSSRAALDHLKQGAIVNVGAVAATSPGVGMAPYAAAKAGVMALTESLAEELKPRGIRVNAVLPTIIDTPANRREMPDADTSAWVTPSSAAKVVAFLLSSDAAAVTGVGIRLSLRDGSA